MPRRLEDPSLTSCGDPGPGGGGGRVGDTDQLSRSDLSAYVCVYIYLC